MPHITPYVLIIALPKKRKMIDEFPGGTTIHLDIPCLMSKRQMTESWILADLWANDRLPISFAFHG